MTVTLMVSAPASVLSLTPRWTWSCSGEVRRHSRGHRDLAQSSGVMESQGSLQVLALPLLVYWCLILANQRPALYLLAQTQWAAVTTWLMVTRLPPQRTEMGPELCLRRLVSLLEMRTFQGAFSAQLETPPRLIGLAEKCSTYYLKFSVFTNNEFLDLRTGT